MIDWANSVVDEDGHLLIGEIDKLDEIYPGIGLLFMYEAKGDVRNRTAAEEIRRAFVT